MKTLTKEKLTIIGAAGMIGSNMAQTALMMGLSSEVCLYDPYEPGLKGVAAELFQSGFDAAHITYTSDIKEALTGAKYVVSSGGAARKAGMTREDLLKGNAGIAEELGKEVEEVKLTTNIQEDLEADSLDLFQIINEIEDEFDVKIETEDGITTVEDLVKYVEKQQA